MAEGVRVTRTCLKASLEATRGEAAMTEAKPVTMVVLEAGSLWVAMSALMEMWVELSAAAAGVAAAQQMAEEGKLATDTTAEAATVEATMAVTVKEAAMRVMVVQGRARVARAAEAAGEMAAEATATEVKTVGKLGAETTVEAAMAEAILARVAEALAVQVVMEAEGSS
jgi:hypothetical protein